MLSEYVKGLDISESKPWQLQQFLTGAEYSSYSIAHNGHVVMHSDNEACLSCLDYAHVDSQPVRSLLTQPCLCNGAPTVLMQLLRGASLGHALLIFDKIACWMSSSGKLKDMSRPLVYMISSLSTPAR